VGKTHLALAEIEDTDTTEGPLKVISGPELAGRARRRGGGAMLAMCITAKTGKVARLAVPLLPLPTVGHQTSASSSSADLLIPTSIVLVADLFVAHYGHWLTNWL